MPLDEKLNAAKAIVNLLKKWPNETTKIYPSFSAAQLKLYETTKQQDLPSVDVLRSRARAHLDLISNKNANLFPISARMQHPDGNPAYYQTIMREADRSVKKASGLRIIRETLFGWLK